MQAPSETLSLCILQKIAWREPFLSKGGRTKAQRELICQRAPGEAVADQRTDGILVSAPAPIPVPAHGRTRTRVSIPGRGQIPGEQSCSPATAPPPPSLAAAGDVSPLSILSGALCSPHFPTAQSHSPSFKRFINYPNEVRRDQTLLRLTAEVGGLGKGGDAVAGARTEVSAGRKRLYHRSFSPTSHLEQEKKKKENVDRRSQMYQTAFKKKFLLPVKRTNRYTKTCQN